MVPILHSLSYSWIISNFLAIVKVPHLPSLWTLTVADSGSFFTPLGRPLPLFETSCFLMIRSTQHSFPAGGCFPRTRFVTKGIWMTSSWGGLLPVSPVSFPDLHDFLFLHGCMGIASSCLFLCRTTPLLSVLLIVLQPTAFTKDAIRFTWAVVLANEFPGYSISWFPLYIYVCIYMCVYVTL